MHYEPYEENIKREADDWIEFTLKSSNRVVDLLFYVDADYIVAKNYEGWEKTEIYCNDYDASIYDEETDKMYSIGTDFKELLNLGYTEEEIEEMDFIAYKMVEELLQHWDYTSEDDIKFGRLYNSKFDKMKFDYKFKIR